MSMLKYRTYRRFVITLLGVVGTLASAPSLWAEPLPNAFTIVETAFTEPRRISNSDGSIDQQLETVKVVVMGSGFRQNNTGPTIWLNGEPTLRVVVAEDGSSLEAYFYQPLDQLEASGSGGWKVEFQDHEGGNTVQVAGPAAVERLSAAERTELNARKQQLGIQ